MVEEVSKPLLISLANRFTNYHSKAEFEDMYNIALFGLFESCNKFDNRNPSFLNYAKVVMQRQLHKEMEFMWAGKRNTAEEVSIDDLNDDYGYEYNQKDMILESISKKEFRETVEDIIDGLFSAENSEILKRYLIDEVQVCDIARESGSKYKKVHSIVRRGKERIEREYHLKYS
jgi:RNA polymerase sigma factor (sigma-70 family)